MDIYKCPFLILKKKFIKVIYFVSFLKNGQNVPILFLSMFLFVLIRVLFLSFFVLFFSYFFGTFSRFSQIFPDFPGFSRIFPSFSYAVMCFFPNIAETVHAVESHKHLVKKNNEFYNIFFCKDSFLKMEFGHL